MANLAALRAVVFSISAKNRTGELKSTPPPVRGLELAGTSCNPIALPPDAHSITFYRVEGTLKTCIPTFIIEI